MTPRELEQAFNKADSLARQGDARAAEDARHFAQEMQRMSEQPQALPEPQNALERGAMALNRGMNSLQDAPIIGPVFRGVRNTAQGIAQGVARGGAALGLVDDSTLKDYEAIAKDSRAQFAGKNPGIINKGLSIGGEIVSTAPLAIGKGLLAATTGGAAYGLSRPVDDGENYGMQKAKDTAISTAAAAGTHGLLAGGSALLNKVAGKVSPASAGLIKEGIRLPPGQARSKGMLRSMEEKFTSVPVVGDIINHSRGKAVEDLNRVAYNRALAPIGKSFPKSNAPGREAVNFVEDTLSQAYDDLLPKMTGRLDGKLVGDMQSVVQQLSQTHSKEAETLSALLQRIVVDRGKGGVMNGETLKLVERDLGTAIRKHSNRLNSGDDYLADALALTKNAFGEMLKRANAGTSHAKELDKINLGWANFERIRSAANASGSKEGVFSAAQLARAVEKLGKGKRNPLMRDLSDPAKAALGQTIPDSGSAGRMFAGLLATGNIGLSITNPVAGAALAGVTLPYLAPNATRKGVQAAGKLIRAGSAPVGLFLAGDK